MHRGVDRQQLCNRLPDNHGSPTRVLVNHIKFSDYPQVIKLKRRAEVIVEVKETRGSGHFWKIVGPCNLGRELLGLRICGSELDPRIVLQSHSDRLIERKWHYRSRDRCGLHVLG